MNYTGKIGLMAVMAASLAFTSCSSDTSSTNAATVNTSTAADAAKDKASNLSIDANKAATDAAPAFDGPLTAMTYENLEHDFGNIDQQTENEYIFKFTNTGTEPLVISNAKGSCGCTVPEYPKEPIAPGMDGEIKVVYKPGKQKNKQTKRVTVTANTDPEQTVLKITADVRELPE